MNPCMILIICDLKTIFKVLRRKLHNIAILFKILKNPWTALMVYLGLRKGGLVHLKNGASLFVSHDNWSNDFLLLKMLIDHSNVDLREDTIFIKPLNLSFNRVNEVEWAHQIYGNLKELTNFTATRLNPNELIVSFNYNGHNVKFVIPIEYSGSFLESYKYNIYLPLNVKDTVVIDVGASFGDTPMYFLLNGAKYVIAVEPYEFIFKYLMKNIELNNVRDRILPLNKAVWSRTGMSTLYEGWFTLTAYKTGKQITVSTITLSDLISYALKIGDRIKIKLDCEGCEYEAIPEALNSGALNNVEEIIMEVHENNSVNTINLLNMLNSHGFKVRIINCIRQNKPYKRVYLVKVTKGDKQ